MRRSRPRAGGRRSGAAARRAAPRARAVAAIVGAGTSDERLQKVLARAGLASRREAEAWIRAGRLTINKRVATLGARVAPHDELRLDGRIVRARPPAAARAFLCHRSPGEALSTTALPADTTAAARTALLERLPRRAGRRFIAVSPMPRSDGGLELVSADGELALRLQRAVRALTSEFGVRVRGELGEGQLEGIRAGMLDSGERLAVERCLAAGGEGANRWYTLTVRGASGKQVRQLVERQGALVSRVLRTRLGPVVLERTLMRGRFRELTQEELRALLPEGGAAAAGAGAAGG
jgi:23S rRNA pseudouridine2605 synthase